MPQLEYRKGTFYQLFDGNVCIYLFCNGGVVCTFAASGIFLHSWKNLERHKQIAISTSFVSDNRSDGISDVFPEALLSSLVPAVVIVGIYLNQETPLYAKPRKTMKRW